MASASAAVSKAWRAARPAYDRAAKESEGVARRFRATVSYDGTAYCGWQTQQSGGGVQDVLEERLSKLFGGRVFVAGSGRTDAGVHARAQVFHFEPPVELDEGRRAAPHIRIVLPEADDAVAAVLERTLTGLGSGLPADVQVTAVSAAPAGFHARDSCVGKRYVYTIEEGAGSPMTRRHRWTLGRGKVLDVPRMAEAAARLVGTHDFSTFGVIGPTDPRSPLKRMRRLEVRRLPRENAGWYAPAEEGGEQDGGGTVVQICAECDRFLFNMMRLLAGTLVQVRAPPRAGLHGPATPWRPPSVTPRPDRPD